jgi:phosphatidylinositol dimannoside acyltransferase
VRKGTVTLTLYRLGLELARWLPFRVCAACGAVGGWFARWILPHRSIVAANLRAIAAAGDGGVPSKTPGELPEGAGDRSVPRRSRPPHVSSVFTAYGRYWGEFLALAARPERFDRLAIRVEGWEHLRRAAALGPVCAVTAHLGNWDLGARFVARRLPRFAVAAEAVEPPALFRLYLQARERAGCLVIPAERGGVCLYRHLRGGGHAGIVADRVFGSGSRSVPFLGGTREFPAAGMDLARRAGASLLPVFLVRDGSGYRLRVHPELPPWEDPVAAFARVLGAEARLFAGQYCLLYPLHTSAPGTQPARFLPDQGKAATA